jgi:hypothetical protein
MALKRISLDTLDTLATQERVHNARKSKGLTRKQERALRRYKGADRSVTLKGVIAPPTKNAAKSAFRAQHERTDTSIAVESIGRIVSVPSKLGC